MRESGLTPDNLTIDVSIWPKLVRPLGFDSVSGVLSGR